MRKGRLLALVLLVFAISICSGVLYANSDFGEDEVNISVNVKEVTEDKNTYLMSEDDFIQITQITQPTNDVSAVKIYTTTFEPKLVLMGGAAKGSKISIYVYTKEFEAAEYPKEASASYELDEIGTTETFTRPIELAEGDNKIVLFYSNEALEVNDKMVFFIRRESSETKDLLTGLLIIPTVE